MKDPADTRRPTTLSNWKPIKENSAECIVSDSQKEVFFDRFQKEILQRWTIKTNDTLKRRLVIGTNACTRLFQSNQSLIRLLVFSGDVDHGATAHLHLLRSMCQIPTIVLPGTKTSRELGTLLGARRVSVLMFLHRSSSEQDDGACDVSKPIGSARGGAVDVDASLDSFLEMVESRVMAST